MYKDLRQFIDTLDREGELQRIKVETDWNREIGAITRRVIEKRAPAPLFEKVKDYPPGYRVMASITGPTRPLHGRTALAMGLPKSVPILEAIDEFCGRMGKPVKPVQVKSGLCKERIQKGDDVNLLSLPAPWIHGYDGGRFIGTWHICVTKDPDTGWVNWGIYRMMVHDEKTVGILLEPGGQHGGEMYFRKYEPRKKPMPIAVAIGTDPISTIAAAVSFPEGVDHVDMAGALNQAPVEMVKCETIDLEVPASSEIVIEGVIQPGARKQEGPFGEYLGYYASGGKLAPYIDVQCITHRSDPILTMTNMGKPWDESASLHTIGISASILKICRDAGIPVKHAYHHVSDCLVISAKSTPDLIGRIEGAAREAHCRATGAHIIVVGDDVDVTDPNEVLWCLATRLHPVHGTHSYTSRGANMLMPWLTPQDRQTNTGSKIYLDCTFPADWPEDYTANHTRVVDFEHGWQDNVKHKVLSRWKEYGYKD
jgi:4-hydroxy-3-polyprenylbenzoate decarboxylase